MNLNIKFFVRILVPLLFLSQTFCAKTQNIADLASSATAGVFKFASTDTNLPDGYKSSPYVYKFATSNGSDPVTFTLSTGSVPGGLTLASSGTLSGTISGLIGAYSFTVVATDAAGVVISQSVNITVRQPFSLLTTSLPAATVSSLYNSVITAQGGTTPYNFTATGMPAGMTIGATSGLVTGTPTGAGNSTIHLTVVDALGVSIVNDIAFSVFNSVGSPSITTSSFLAGTLGTSYADATSVTGGMTPYAYAISAGTLPPGLSMNASTGVISGTPTAVGIFGFTVRVTDNLGVINSRGLSITIGSSASPTFSTATFVNGAVSQTYRDVVQASGGSPPYTFSITSGSLPAGLSLASGTGLVTGTPSTASAPSFILRVTDSLGSFTSQSFSITIAAPPTPSISTASLVGGNLTVVYRDVVIATGGTTPYTFSISAGALPNGLTIDANSGIISGTPTVTGTFNFTARVQDSLLMSTTRALSIVIGASPVGPLSIQTTTLLPIVVLQNSSRNVTATGGLPPYTYSVMVGSIPAGISLSASTGALTGVPSSTGTSTFTIQVQDSVGTTASQALSLVVVNPLTVITASLPFAVTSNAYSTTIAASGGTAPYTFSATGIPSGLAIASGSGIISGAAVASGVSTVTVTVTDANGLTGSKALTFNVVNTIAITAAATLRATLTNAYNYTPIVTGGQSPFSYSLSTGSLPAGLSLNSSSGLISGTPTKGANLVTGTFSFTVAVTDVYGQTASRGYTMTVTVPPRVVSDANKKLRTVGRTFAYVDWITRTGGQGAVTFSATGFPAGLTVDATSGRVSGTTTDAAGDYTVSVTVTDSYGISHNLSKLIKVTGAAKTFGFDGPSIASMANNSARANYQDMTHADLNGDGCVDAAASSYTSKEVIVFINDKVTGNCVGTFTSYAFTPSGFPVAIVAADFNADGRIDLAVSEQSTGGNIIEIIAGTAVTDNGWTLGGAAQTRQYLTGLTTPSQIELGDINGDGRLDIMVGNAGAGNVMYFLNCGGATTNYNGGTPGCTAGTPSSVFNFYAPPAFTMPANANNNTLGVGLSDLNGDGALDLIVGSYGSGRLSVFAGLKTTGTPNGTFNTTPATQIAGYNYGWVRTHIEPTAGWTNTAWTTAANYINMNGDANKDVVVQANTVGVIAIGDGLGNLTASYTADVSDLTISAVGGAYVKVADVNNDTFQDVVMSTTGTGRKNINVFFNATGTGSLSGRRTFTDGYFNIFTLGLFSQGATRPGYLGLRAWNSAAGYTHLLLRKNTNTSTAYTGGAFYYAYTSSTGVLQDLGSSGAPQIGDLNGDGYPDVVIRQTGTASTFLGSPSGVLTSQVRLYANSDTSTITWFGRQIALSDIDGDNILDLATANYNGSNYSSVALNLGNGDGTFGSLQYLSADGSGCITNLGATVTSFGDFNRDSRMDMAVGLSCNNQAKINVFYGSGDGTFSNSASPYVINVPQGTYVDNMIVNDADGDGIYDIIVGTRNGYLISYQGVGDGTFTFRSSISASIGSNVTALDSGDVNADGIPDYLVATNAGGAAVILGGSNLTLNAPSTYAGLALFNFVNMFSAAFADFDSDGKLDVVLAKQYLGIQVLTGANNGSFTNPATPFALANPANNQSYMITSADMNGDGMPDIMATNADGNQASSLSVNINRCQ